MYYYYNYQDAGYPGEPLPDNGGSFPGIFHIVINQSSQTNILFKITNHVLFREAIMQEKCSFFNIVQKAFGPPPPPPLRLNIMW